MARGVVLGATAGIGAAVVTRRAGAGDEVVAVGRRRTVTATPPASSAAWISADIRDYSALREVLLGGNPPDYVVNCVGVGFYAPLGGDRTEAWQEILDTDVRGLLNLASIVTADLPGLRDLVHISSLAAHRVSETPGNLVYSVAKAGGRTVVSELRRELRAAGRSTRVSMISPGFVEGTDFGGNFYRYADPHHARTALYDTHRNLVPDDVAGVVDYVLGLPAHVEVLDLLLAPTAQPA